MNAKNGKLITIRIPRNMDKKIIEDEIEKLMENKYGYVKIEKLRKRLGIKRLKKDVYTQGDEELLSLSREKAKRRVDTK